MTNELGIDRSGNNNHWTVNNLTLAADQMLDTPTNNFATLNSLDSYVDTLAEGSLEAVMGGSWKGVRGTLAPSTGKWYYEAHLDTVTTYAHIGVCDVKEENGGKLQDEPNSWWYRTDGSTSADEGTSANASLTAPSDDDIVQIAYDLDAGKIWFGVNNTWVLSGDPEAGSNEVYSGLSGTLAPALGLLSSTVCVNYGQDSGFAGGKTPQGNQDSNSIGDFYYTPPTDFLALCTSNLPAVAVIPSEHFNTKIWTGTTADQAITGVGFQPDFVWIKKRSASYNHYLNDAVRGQGKTLYTDGTYVEYDYGVTQLISFDSDGYTLDGGGNYVNANTLTYVGWNWKANGSGSANAVGDIASTVSVNTDAGFSIVSYTGNASTNQTVGHGLSKIPEIVIIKGRENTSYWSVINPRRVDTSDTNILYLNVANPEADDTNIMGDNLPTATTFGVDDYGAVNTNGEGHIAYCFHSVDGYSKVGSYTGNNDADGPFIYLGFRPKYFMIKAATTTDSWVIYDSLRDSDGTSGFNKGTAKLRLFGDSDGGETEIGTLDFLSTGIKIRASGLAMNEAHTYIYLAFAETPFKYSNAK